MSKVDKEQAIALVELLRSLGAKIETSDDPRTGTVTTYADDVKVLEKRRFQEPEEVYYVS